ncbi:helix-turn-helix transcriptional regulator [Pseudonocardia pini]|uniref:helix-turn-helix transcriptional regulator n=1 Tax=Pseudonocardia pini TaxID=2758030 RepID=UPI0015F08FE3|nr:LuxR C-terminal-related transcriptional regulator [Pseudonocardia pini]
MRIADDGGGLTVRDYARVFDVLERVNPARDVDDFRERTLEAFGSVLGYRNTTFFRGPTYATLFEDPDPLLNGRMRALVREYRSGWSKYDVFSLPESLALLGRTHAVSVDELHRMPEASRLYLDDWLARRGLPSANAVYVRPAGEHALIGVFGEEGVVGPADLRVLRLLGRQLSALCRHLPGSREDRPDLGELSPRHREVAALVCEGLTNATIGRVLSLTEGTVKKYVSHVLAATACRSRTELVLRLRSPG